jgi:urea transporter
MLAGLGVGDPYLAALAAVGAATSTATARLAGLDPAAISAGLYGYNGTLIGCAFSVFLSTSPPVTLAATVVGAAAAPFVGRAIAPLCGGAPPFTLAFNAVALPALAVVRPFAAKTAAVDSDAAVVAAAAAGSPAPATEAALNEVTNLMLCPLTGVSQIFVVESPLSGVLLPLREAPPHRCLLPPRL